jgi:ribonuclease-3
MDNNFQDTMDRDLKELQNRIGYKFRTLELLKNALMHTSYVNELGLEKTTSNQRLEYLGDAVIELAVTNTLFELLPEADEGQLTSLRAELVCTSGLSRVANDIELGKYLVLGRGADKSGERENPTVLEDAFEALAGAVFIDGGWRKAAAFVDRTMKVFVLNAMSDSSKVSKYKDRKSALQMELQKTGTVKISYKLKKTEGPPHERIFHIEVHSGGKHLGTGIGLSKKEAEQNAAGEALRLFGK